MPCPTIPKHWSFCEPPHHVDCAERSGVGIHSCLQALGEPLWVNVGCAQICILQRCQVACSSARCWGLEQLRYLQSFGAAFTEGAIGLQETLLFGWW